MTANPTPLPLDAAARDELARKAEAARDTMAYAACRVLDGQMDHEANAIASRAQGEFLHAVSSPDVILALLAAVERGAEETETLDGLLDDVLLAMREPMTLADAREARTMLTRISVSRKKAKVRAARATPTGADHAE